MARSRSKGPKFYAVANGREGSKIYENWPEAEAAITGVKRVLHKSFPTLQEAEDFIASKTMMVQVQVVPPDGGSPQRASQSISPSVPQLQPKSVNIPVTPISRVKQAAEFKPRLTTRYEPYPQPGPSVTSGSTIKPKDRNVAAAAASKPSTNAILSHGIPPVNPPRKVLSSQGSSATQPTSASSQSNPIPVSSDVEEDEDEIRCTGSSSSAVRPNGAHNIVRDVHQHAAAAIERRVLEEKQNSIMTSNPVIAPSVPLQQPATNQRIEATDKSSDEPKLSDEQSRILQRVMNGESIFYTGSAGVGKSVLTRAIIKNLHKKYPGENGVGVTATTGIAATNIGGTTLHSWAGLGLARGDVERLFWSLMKGKSKGEALTRWKQCKALVIDEVSMLDCGYFDTLEEIARRVRDSKLPFGGIQLVITGDFFQLPPVMNITGPGQPREPTKFVFESKSWKTAVPNLAILTQVFRQRDDTFVRLLNELRVGKPSKEANEVFLSLGRKVVYDDGIEPTCLFPKRNQVLYENNRRLNTIKTNALKFTAYDASGHEEKSGTPIYPDPVKLREVLDKNTLVEQSLDLKVGAQVMLVKNLKNKGLVNGSIGKIIGFASGDEIAAARSGRMFGERDNEMQEERYFDEAHLAKEMETDKIKQVKKEDSKASLSAATAIKAAEDRSWLAHVQIASAKLTAREAYRLGYKNGEEPEESDLNDLPVGMKLPVVVFQKHGSGSPLLLPVMEFSVEDSKGRVEASRQQVPLILAWALSIHKSQGQTLERVRVDLGEIFEAGQSYVALSRATQMETLQCLRFNPIKVKAHPKVIKWYESISNQ